MAQPVKTFPLTAFTDAEKVFDEDFARPARGVYINATGTLFARDVKGTTMKFVVGSSSPLPYPLFGINLRRIVGDGSGNIGNGTTGTDIALADLVLLHD